MVQCAYLYVFVWMCDKMRWCICAYILNSYSLRNSPFYFHYFPIIFSCFFLLFFCYLFLFKFRTECWWIRIIHTRIGYSTNCNVIGFVGGAFWISNSKSLTHSLKIHSFSNKLHNLGMFSAAYQNSRKTYLSRRFIGKSVILSKTVIDFHFNSLRSCNCIIRFL